MFNLALNPLFLENSCWRFVVFVSAVNFHFFIPPIRNKSPIVKANNEYIVSDVKFVLCNLPAINSPSPRNKYIPAIKKITGFKNGSFLNLLSTESLYSLKIKKILLQKL